MCQTKIGKKQEKSWKRIEQAFILNQHVCTKYDDKARKCGSFLNGTKQEDEKYETKKKMKQKKWKISECERKKNV